MPKKIIRSGNSLAVTIPAEFAKDLNLSPGDEVEIKVNKYRNVITYKFRGNTQLSLSPELFKSR